MTIAERSEQKVQRWSVNGDGTVTDTVTGLMWVQAPWGMDWNGTSFDGTPAKLTWYEATELFGKGPAIGGEGTGSLSTGDIDASNRSKQYTKGTSKIEFAGFNDWSLATPFDWNTFHSHRKMVSYDDFITELEHAFPYFAAELNFWTACAKWEYTGLARLTAGKDYVAAWRFNMFDHIDAHGSESHPVLFVRQGMNVKNFVFGEFVLESESRVTEFSQAIESALSRYKIEQPFSKNELDDKCRYWVEKLPAEMHKQVHDDYRILIAIAG